MHLSQFLNELFEHGNVRLGDAPAEFETDDSDAVRRILIERERFVAAEFPEPIPTFEPEVAAWGARQLFRLAHFVLHRASTIDSVRDSLAETCPAGDSAAQHYSVDLTFRFLPDVDRLSATLAQQDPLRDIIRQWGAQWPLSSVGIKGCEPLRVADLLAHPGLRQAYVDRIIERRDASRLRDQQVRNLVGVALGRERTSSATWCNPAAITTGI